MADEPQAPQGTEAILDNFIETMPAPDNAPVRDPDTGQFVSKTPSEPVTAEAQAEAPAVEDAAAETPSGEEAEAEPEIPAIEPPLSWTAEAKEAFTQLPPDLQQYVGKRESEREQAINAKLSEAAEQRKTYERETATAQQRQQQYAQTIQSLLNAVPILSPILAEGARTDWPKLRQEDPVAYLQKWGDYQDQVNLVNWMQSEQQRIQNEQNQTGRKERLEKLSQAFPDFADATKAEAKWSSYGPVLTSAGFSKEEIDAAKAEGIPPHYVRLIELASEGAALKAAQKTIGDKKVVPQAKPVVRPKASDDKNTPESTRLAALRKNALAKDQVGRFQSETAMLDYVLASQPAPK